MQQYLDMLKYILEHGYETGDRTGVGTIALPGYFYQVPLQMDDDGTVHGYPLLTTKKVFLRGTFMELMWKLRGETNIRSLVMNNVNIWTEWPFKKWLEETGELKNFAWYVDDAKSDYSDEWKSRLESFKKQIINDEAFAEEWGNLGPTYGHHMRDFGEVRLGDTLSTFSSSVVSHMGFDPDTIIRRGIDQLDDVIYKIKNKPEDRRIIMSLWNPHDNKNTLLPPCPCFYQFFANQEGYLHLNVYQRSCDSLLGVPFNDSQDALLLILMAMVTGRKPGMFNHTFGDVHIYKNHIEQVKLQLTREPKPLPSIRINRHTTNILDFEYPDIELIGYDPYPAIRAPVAV